ncbi:methyltransferase domain-containing protein [Crocosphaera sp. XPORK-15E]|uniref:methyltransferase domain-containing protein n=1 Tax=Crocosphaera sp. XPORK-15E TaxID=3110247 RepID=UPI002B2088C1|nr:methyltransferase domain-containing protein [Crocosphaera sp. XPORK-15E]MEA5533969.1 methyltransferase domain-containing protein [Crocosphaera sp. XPORK-15E]
MATLEIISSCKKEKIADNFSKGVSHYLEHSQVQKECADKLLNILRTLNNLIPDGSILEIGCGTGFVTQGLIKQFPNRFLDIIDISLEMLNYCQENLQISDTEKELIKFKEIDGEKLDIDNNSYAAIISSFTVQWFQDIINSFNRLIKTLKPGGILLVAFPNDRCFPEWKNACDALNLPFTRNQLPNSKQLIQNLPIDNIQTYFYEDEITISYKNASEFFRSIKVIGAGLNLNNQKLSIPEMKQLINYWNNHSNLDGIEVTYHVTFLVITKIS